MKEVAVITSAFGYGLDDRERTYEQLFLDEGLSVRYCTRDELLESPEGVEGIIVGIEEVNEELFSTCKDVRVALKFGVGMDNFDKSSAKRFGVLLGNLPGINSDAVAELAIALMLNISRRINEMHSSCTEGLFSQICAHTIMGKTLGIIGVGSIGARVARIAQAFSMNCIGYDVHPISSPDVRQVNLQTLVSESDIITIHIPLTSESYHIIDSSMLNLMKQGAILINTSRGGIVDEVALETSLKNGHLYGAGLDVYESKESITRLLNYPGMICTPHVAAYTHETLRNMEVTIIKKIANLLDEVVS